VVRRKTAFHSPNRQNVGLLLELENNTSASAAPTAFFNGQLLCAGGLIDKTVALLEEETQSD
jgi:hypothetical protein